MFFTNKTTHCFFLETLYSQHWLRPHLWTLPSTLATTFCIVNFTKNWKHFYKYVFSQIKLHTFVNKINKINKTTHFFPAITFVNMLFTNKTTHCFFHPDYCVFVILFLYIYSLHITTTRMRTASIILYKTRTCELKLYLNLAAWKSDRIRDRNGPAHICRESSSILASDTPYVRLI